MSSITPAKNEHGLWTCIVTVKFNDELLPVSIINAVIAPIFDDANITFETLSRGLMQILLEDPDGVNMIDIILSTGTDGINELIRTYNVARSNDFVYDQIQIERRADQIEQRADQIEKRIDQIERADIIAEQDRLYQQSLDADIKKEQQKQAEREEQEVLDRRSAMTPQERRAMISASYDKVKKETPVEQNLHTIPQKQETDEEKRRHICAARLAALAKRI